MAIEAIVLKNGDKRYRATLYYTDKYGKEKKVRGALRNFKKLASDDYEMLFNNYKNGSVIESSKKINFFELSEKWFENKVSKRIEKSTQNFYRIVLNKYLQPRLGHYSIRDISTSLIEKKFGEICEIKVKDGNRISPKQYNHVISVCKSIFKYGVLRKFCNNNPSEFLEKMRISDQPFTFMDEKQVVEFLTHARLKYQQYKVPYYLYLLGFNLGLRIGELIALKWENVNFNAGTILISRSYDKQAYIIKNYPKGKRYRVLWMNQSIKNALTELRAFYPNAEFVFTNPSHTGHIYYRNFRERIFLKDIEDLGIKNFNMHGMRHTYAILYLMGGGKPHELQLLMGHEDIQTTMKYTRFSDDYLKGKADVVNVDAKLPDDIKVVSFNRKK